MPSIGTSSRSCSTTGLAQTTAADAADGRLERGGAGSDPSEDDRTARRRGRMRRSRRGGHRGMEFGGSGEDSFVAVVVTKLTGALLFILLLTMVIMALLAQGGRPARIGLEERHVGFGAEFGAAGDRDSRSPSRGDRRQAVRRRAGRHRGERAAPLGGRRDIARGTGLRRRRRPRSTGTPKAGTPEPAALVLRVSDGHDRTSLGARLVVYQSDQPLTMPSKWKPRMPPIPWSAWLDQGFGFLMLWLVHLVGMNTLGNLERWSLAKLAVPEGGEDGPEGEAQGPAEVDTGQLRNS